MSDIYEPWKHVGQGDIIDAHGNDVACVYLRESFENEDVARRVVACVNACAGMDVATLELQSGLVLGMFVTGVETTKRRDELLALVKGFHRKLETYRNVYSGDKELRRLLGECEEAIAKAKP